MIYSICRRSAVVMLALSALSGCAVYALDRALQAEGRANERQIAKCDGAAVDPQVRIDACTAIIDSGRWHGKNLAFAYINRGNAYGELGEHRRTIEDYDQALRLDPGHANAYFNRGNAYRDLGEYRRAIEDYEQALRIDPRDTGAYRYRGIAYKSLGDFERAAGDWEQEIRVGGASWAKNWQKHMKGKGHYAGAIDGVFGPDMPGALMACAADPACGVGD